jgi:hypothetical protein
VKPEDLSPFAVITKTSWFVKLKILAKGKPSKRLLSAATLLWLFNLVQTA